MLAADAELDLGPGGPSLIAAHLHQLADAVLVEGDEGVDGEDLALDVVGQELAGVVTGEPVSGLSQVVGAEGEEVGFAGRSRRR